MIPGSRICTIETLIFIPSKSALFMYLHMHVCRGQWGCILERPYALSSITHSCSQRNGLTRCFMSYPPILFSIEARGYGYGWNSVPSYYLDTNIIH